MKDSNIKGRQTFFGKRILSFLLSIAMMLTLVSGITIATPVTVSAADAFSPVVGSSIYFGGTENDGYGKEWIVVSTSYSTGNGTGILAVSADIQEDIDYGGSDWSGSAAETWCNDFASDLFTTDELSGLMTVNKTDEEIQVGAVWYNSTIVNSKVFFLSASEANSMTNSMRAASSGWWLRSPSGNQIGAVNADGSLTSAYDGKETWGARPAIVFDPSVIDFFTTEDFVAAYGDNAGVASAPTTPASPVKGDFVKFDDITWRVLNPSTTEFGGTGMLLVSQYVLETDLPYDETFTAQSWGESDLKAWCTSFANGLNAPLLSATKSSSSGYYNALSSENVFFLSSDEISSYFSSNSDRQAWTTGGSKSAWWTRDNGGSSYPTVYYVTTTGAIAGSELALGEEAGARPAVVLDLSKAEFTYNTSGGSWTVSSSATNPVLTNVTAEATGTTTAKVSWTVSNTGGGTLSYSVSGGGTASVSGTSATITGLSANTSYTFTLKATNTSGLFSSYTATVRTKPNPVTNLKTTTVSNTGVTLSWTRPSSYSGVTYNISYSGGSTGSTTATSSSTTKSITGLLPNKSYTFKVVVSNTGGDSTAATTSATTVPDPVTNLKATASGTSVTLSWTRPSNYTGVTYNISYSYSGGSTSTTTATSSSTSKSITGLTAGKEYTFTVTVSNSGGSSTAATAKATPDVPPGAVTISSTTGDDKKITVNWSAPTNTGSAITGYTIYYTPAGGTTKTQTASASSTSATISSLTNGTEYTIQMSATNGAGEGDKGSSVTEIPGTSPTLTNVTAKATGNKTAEISWTVSNTGGGTLTYEVTGGGTVTVSGTKATITGLSANTSYTFKVKAANTAGFSTTYTVTALTYPDPVTSLTYSHPSGTSVRLNWTAPSNSTDVSYTVSGSGTISQSGTDTTATITNLSPNTSYTYTVYATNSSGNSTGETITIRTPASSVTGLTAKVHDTTPTTVVLSWTAPSGGAGEYGVDWTDNSGNPTTTTGTSCTITGLTKGKSYEFSVMAANSDGTYYVGTIATTTLTLPTNPDPVSGLTSSNLTTTSVKLSWTAPSFTGNSPLTGYTVTGSGTITKSGTTATITGLAPNTSYTFTVIANNKYYSSTSKTITITTSMPTPAVTASATGSTTATVSWSMPSGTNTSGVTYTVTGGGTVTYGTNSATITGLAPNTSYTFKVKATGSTGNSATGTASAIVTRPPTPTVTASATGNKTATVSWSVPSNTSTSGLSYTVSWSGGSTGSTTVSGTSKSTSISGLNPNSNYTFKVVATGSTGYSSAAGTSNTILTYPDPVTNVVATASTTDATKATVTWTAPSSTSGVSYEVSGGGTVSISGTTATITNLSPNTSYTFTVKSKNSSGYSTGTSATSIKTIPNPPTNLKTTSVSGTSVTLSWTAPSSSSGVTYTVTGGGTATISGTTATITGLKGNTDYTFTVKSKNSTGSSATGAEISLRTTIPPLTVTATPTSIGTAEVSWSLPSGTNTSGVTYTVTGGGTATISGTTAKINGLSPNTSYTFTVTAKSSTGSSASGTADTILTYPASVSGVTASVHATTATTVNVSWTAPTNNSNLSYGVRWSGTTSGSTTVTSTSTSVTGLTKGGSYEFVVYAQNATGKSEGYSDTIELPTNPGDPTGVSASAKSKSEIEVTWTAPTNTGNVPIKNYTISWTGGSTGNTTATSSPVTISGLEPNTEYTFTVKANNGYYSSNAVSSDPEPTHPDGVSTVTATATGGTTATVTWDPPENDSGISYKVTWSGTSTGSLTGITATSVNVTGLTKGGSYTFEVDVVETDSDVPASSSTIKTWTNPNPPTGLKQTAIGTTTATLSWTAPSFTGNTDLTGYTVSGSGTKTHNGGTATTTNITGLAANTDYTYTVTAKNAGYTSLTAASVTIRTKPNPVTNVNATVHSTTGTTANISWTAPTKNDGLTYKVSWSGTTSGSLTGITTTSTSVTGLTKGGSYTFTVYATNSSGDSTGTSDTLTMPTNPGVPTGIKTTSVETTTAAISWTAPTNTGNVSLTGYIVSGSGTISQSGTNTSASITGLAPNTSYTYTVKAKNAYYESTTAASITLLTKPNPVTGVTAKPTGDTTATVSWTAPTNNSGLSYTVSWSGTSTGSTTVTTTSASITGLTKGGNYTFTVIAKNTTGSSTSASSSQITTWKEPGAPTGLKVTDEGNTQLTVSWTEPTDKGGVGATIKDYKIYLDGSTTAYTKVTISGTTATITGLTNGEEYTVRVAAVNAANLTGAQSDPATGTPRTRPGAPTGVTVTRGDKQLSISWTAPTETGGSPLATYTVYYTSTAGGTKSIPNITGTSYTITGLTNGTTYTIEVTATNEASLEGTKSDSKTGMPAKAPAKPTGLELTRGDGQLTAKWNAVTDTGANSITGYKVYLDNTYKTTVTGTSTTITGLTNGKTYSVYVVAVNDAKLDSEQSKSEGIMVATNPAAPEGLSLTRGDKQLTASWTAVTNHGANKITGYQVYLDGELKTTVTGTSTTITGLTNGKTYSVYVVAVNDANLPSANSETKTVMPATNPAAPANVKAKGTNAQLTVTWDAVTDTGANEITEYIVYLDGEPKTTNISISGTTATITGLTNGQEYDVQVKAVNDADLESELSSVVIGIPTTIPDPVTSVTATVTSGTTATVSWSAPANTGGSEITGYTIKGGATDVTVDAGVTTTEISGLTKGTKYTFKVVVHNEAGYTSVETAAPEITTWTNPGEPTGVTATETSGTTATVSWTAPTFTGYTTLTGYTITGGPEDVTVGAGVTSTTIDGLTRGTKYTFKVRANNAAKYSSEYVAAAEITTWDVPDAPGNVVATVTSGTTVDLTWTVPNNNGSAITKYVITGGPADIEISGAEVTKRTVNGLTKGTAYTFSVYAVNAVEGDPRMGTAEAVTTWTNPGDPTGVTATATSDTTAKLTWTAPEFTGYCDLTGYTVTGGGTVMMSGTTATITGLEPGTDYTFTVVAHNEGGYSSQVVSANTITTWDVPEAPGNVVATVTSGETVDVTWTVPANNGSAITHYVITGGPTDVTVNGANATRGTVSGLEWGTTYTFKVYAVNAVKRDPRMGTAAAVTTWDVPDPPATVNAEVLTGTSVKLTWSASKDNGAPVTNYVISGTSAGAEITFGDDGLSATITGLNRNTVYTLGVAGKNSVGTGEPKTVSVKTLIPPTVPSISVEPDDESIHVTITPPADDGGADIKEYVVYYKEAGATTWKSQSATGTTTTIENLKNGTSYTLWATATNAEDLTSEESAEVTTIPRRVPDAPIDVTATVTGKTTVNVTWKAPYDGGNAIDEYIVEVKATGGEWTEKTRVNALKADIDGLTPNTEYTFRVSARNDAGTGEADESLAVKTWIEPDAPEYPEVKATNVSGEAKLTWQTPFDGNTPILRYILYVDGVEREDEISADATEYLITDLKDGQKYTIQLAAENAAGKGAKTNELSVTTVTNPGAPTITEIKSGTGQAFISIGAPEDNGGAAITDYKIYVNGDYNKTVSYKQVSDIAIDDLKNKETYEITVTAVNAAGLESDASEPESIKVGMPNPPENIKVVPGNAEFSVSYDPAEGNGNVITGYEIWVDGKVAKPVGGDVLSTTVGGLINGETYMVQVRALSAAGESRLSDEYPVTPGIPTAPVIEEVTTDDTSITLSWTAAETHNMRLIGYYVYVNGAKVKDTTASVRTAILTDLTKGQEYVIEVAGVSIAGEGIKSNPYTIVLGAPEAPENVNVTGGNGTLTVTWTAADGNGNEVTGYNIYVDGDKKATAEANETEKTIEGLANGQTYTIEVSANNTHGEGSRSKPKEGTPIAPPGDIEVSGLIATVTGATSAKLTWNAPINDGGSPILGYEIGGAEGATVVVNGTMAEITGLERGTEYTFSVVAKNAAGGSPEAFANTIRTWTVPDAPVIRNPISGNGKATVIWDAPKNDGGSAVTSYNVYVNGVKHNKTPITGTSYTIDNLTNGKFYYFRVSAVNAVDEGEKSEEKELCIGTANPPEITGVIAGDSSATITWIRPEKIYYEITGYTIYVDGKAKEVIGDGTEYTIKGLTNGVTYTIALSTLSEGGESAKSEPVTVIPGTLPPPTTVQATAGNAIISLSWDAVEEAKQYVIYLDGEAIETQTGTSYTITGLSNREYEVCVATENDFGIGVKSAAVKVTPWTVPDAPVITGLVSTVDGFKVTYTEPKSNGKEISHYEIIYSVENGEETVIESNDLTATVSKLTVGERYSVTVKAVNEDGDASEASIAAKVTIGAPGATQITYVENGDVDGELTVHYTAAAQNGGAITHYNIYAEVARQDGIALYANEPIVVKSEGTSAKIEGLESGVTYAITVEAVNSIGTGPRSEPYYAVPGRAGKPILSSAIADDQKVTLIWQKPLENGDSVIKYKIYVDGNFYAETTDLTKVVADLENGREYKFSVSAVNGHGEGAESDPKRAIPCTTPDAPQDVKAVPSSATSITLTWRAPVSNGGKPITEYIVEGEGTITMGEDGFSAEITGLERGTEYTFTVAAVNECGTGEAAESEAITTYTAPGKAGILYVKPGDSMLTIVEWEAPKDDGGSKILGYNVYYQESKLDELKKLNGDTLVTELPYEIKGLTNGQLYYLYIAAVNDIDEGEKSFAYGAEPVGRLVIEAPYAPQNVSAEPGNEIITVTWDEPVFDGNSDIAGYYVYLGESLITQSLVTGMSHTITGLESGKEYIIRVSAVNEAGFEGERSEPLTVKTIVPPPIDRPDAVADDSFTFTIDYDKQNAILVWEAPDYDGGSEILGYRIYVNGYRYGLEDELIEDTTFVFPVEFEQRYAISVVAVNEVGESEPTRNLAVIHNVNNTDAEGNIYNRDINNNWVADLDIDTDDDRIPDININTDDDDYPEVNTDTDGDWTKAELNIDWNNDGVRDLNIDTDEDRKADINIELTGGTEPHLNIDVDGDEIADTNIDLDEDNRADLFIDSDKDGKPDVNIDLDGDKVADINVDTNGDAKADLNIDTNGDDIADLNIDLDGDGKKADLNIDTNNNRKPDVNVDTDGDGVADTNIDTNGDLIPDENVDPDYDPIIDGDSDIDNDTEDDNIDTADDTPINIDVNNDGKADLNIDVDGDGIADVNFDTDGDNKADLDVDTNGDGKKDLNIDTDKDGEPDLNIDKDGDGLADVNIDTNGDGKRDINVDTDGDGVADRNIDVNGDGIPDLALGWKESDGPSAPEIIDAISDRISTIQVIWTADNAEAENVVGYNVYVNGEMVAENHAELYYDITDANAETTYEIYVTAVNVDGEEGAQSNLWTAVLIPDTPIPSVQLKVTGVVVFSGARNSATVQLLDNGIEIGTAEAGNGDSFEIAVDLQTETLSEKTYSIVVTAKNATTTTITGIPLADSDVDIGDVTIYPGDANGDGRINSRDALIVKNSLGEAGADVRGDVNGDGRVNSRDTLIVENSLGKTSTVIQWN